MQLSVLDQSPVRKGSTAEDALKETVALAKLADNLGYTRFWVSEHHNTNLLAGTAPEILMAHLAGQTKRIRLGSGGVMLPHYSALKVAENFRLLEALFPGRIDLGVGRAPGGDRLTAAVLNPGNNFSEEDFVQQLFDVQNYLNDQFEHGTVQEKVRAMPQAASVPQQWILSSSGQSGLFAAHFGMGFSFAHFINPAGGAKAVNLYKSRFQPSVNLKSPEANMAIFYFCSEEEEKVMKQRAIMDHRFLQFEKGVFEAITFNDIKDLKYTAYEQERIEVNRLCTVIGSKAAVKERLINLATEYGVDEIILVNIASEFDERLHSYELAAELFELGK